MLYDYKNIETTGACVSFQHASATDSILLAISSIFWLKYRWGCVCHTSIYLPECMRCPCTARLIQLYRYIHVTSSAYVWFFLFFLYKKAAFVMSHECVAFFDSPPLVYPGCRLQISVAYLIFQQAVYSLVDGTLYLSLI